MDFTRIASAIVFLMAGVAVFLLLCNRTVLHMKDGPWKTLTALGLIGVAAFSLLCGLIAGFSVWLIIPSVLLSCVVLGEIRRVLIRRKCRASGPVETRTVGLSVLRPFTTRNLAFRRYEVTLSHWPINRLRVMHISDLHVTDKFPRDYYLTAMEQVAEAKPDLLFITGDFVSESKFVSLLPDILCRAKGRLGTFAVLGNHDYWANASAVADAVNSTGIDLLHNSWRRVQVEDNFHITVSGCEDPWGPDKWRVPTTSENDPLFVLAHTADNIYKLSKADTAAVFAGHYHGGQGTIPLIGPVFVPSKYGRLFDHGHFNVNGTHLFVSSGIGTGDPPLRIYCRPEITAIDFLGALYK